MVPMLCVRFLRVKPGQSEAGFDTPFYRTYRAMLLLGLRMRGLSLLGVAEVRLKVPGPGSKSVVPPKFPVA